MRLVWTALLVAATGCAASSARRASAGAAPVAPSARESLHISVVYPDTAEPIQAQDSSFLFGSVGRGRVDVALSVNGQSIPVYASGSWLAWVPLPHDSLVHFHIVARTGAGGGGGGAEQRETTFVARIAQPFQPPAGAAAWIDTTSFSPTDSLAFPAGEGIRLSLRATPGARVRLRIEGKGTIWFVPDTLPEEPAWGVRAFGTDTTAYQLPVARDRYVAWLPAQLVCDAIVEAIVGTDTARAVWPLVVDTVDRAHPTVIVLNDDTAHTGTTDSLTVGKAVPYGTYNWFFPTGTTAVADGRWSGQTRLRLSRGAVAWVNTADVVPLAPGTPPPGGIVGSVRLIAGPRSLILRVPLPARVPFKVEEDERSLTVRLYGVFSDVNWMQHGGTDSYVTRMSYAQPTVDEVTVTLSLAGRVWGYRSRWSGRDLVLEIRRPPVIDPRRPLAGRTIVLDPGHPPLGAKGPSGLWEPVAVLAVAQQAKTLLEGAGATALLTRTDSTPIELYPRTHFAELHDADVLVSIHANALPDGINPFVNNGTSVYYFHPRSAALARALDRALVAELGVHDLGMGRGDYALVRDPWMPSALTEGLFMMIPEQEAMLASPEGRLRYARGVAKGIEDFLREMAR
ncbi:MAG TPA: N-acetylmuramoyl-L-alanine amidase [Gemmatimonadales bacterium]|nr:N-acetylmuramoyl-L-alanine amidase [Gemmatimonadales bacterium]